MSYYPEDLSVFEPLDSPDECVGTSYFEFHPKELPRQNACWLLGSLFLQDAAFDFFAECFKAASKSFDYFSFRRFGEQEIAAVVRELGSYLNEIDQDQTRGQLFSRYASEFKFDMWSEVPTEELAKAVCHCGLRLLTFIESETEESRCLWVLGM